jgi:hypothetical protein
MGSLRYRLFAIWLFACICLVALYLRQSGTGARLLTWNGAVAVAEEPQPNAVIVMLVAPSRIMRGLSATEMHSRVM